MQICTFPRSLTNSLDLSSNSAERNAQESPLLRLPPELRNRIWTYVLSTKDDITGRRWQGLQVEPRRNTPGYHWSLPLDLRRDCSATIRSWVLPFQKL